MNRIRRSGSGWLWASLIGAAGILLPILYVFLTIFRRPNENWAQIREFALKEYFLNTVAIVGAACTLAAGIGIALAWLIAAYDFPLKRVFGWALLLPLAVPPYIAAYTYSSMLSYTGVVQTGLRGLGIPVKPQWFDIMSMKGAIFVFTVCLYPYVYMLARAFLERQSASFVENAKLLGRGPAGVFFRVVLPLSRPALAGGASLVAFETLSDYGVTNYFGIPTLTTAVFQTWFGLYDVDSAMRLAAWLMAGIVGFFIAERLLRRRRLYGSTPAKARPLAPEKLRGPAAAAATAFCFLVWAPAFGIPFAQLLYWAILTYGDVLSADFLALTWNSVYVAAAAAVLIVVFSVVAANAARSLRTGFAFVLPRIVTAGYSVPGAVIAIGVLAVFLSLDRMLAPIYAHIGLGRAPLVLSMSLAMLVAGYVIRFTATGYNAVEAGFEKIGKTYGEASRMLGHGMTATFFKVELPLIKGAVGTGFLLTFVEIVKELPLVLLLRPFNFETLATKAYQYAGDEQIQEASLPSLIIIGISLISVLIIRRTERRRNG